MTDKSEFTGLSTIWPLGFNRDADRSLQKLQRLIDKINLLSIRPFICRCRCQNILFITWQGPASCTWPPSSLSLTLTIPPIQQCFKKDLSRIQIFQYVNIGRWSHWKGSKESTDRWELDAWLRDAVRRWLRFREFVWERLRRQRNEWREHDYRYRSRFITSRLFWGGIPSARWYVYKVPPDFGTSTDEIKSTNPQREFFRSIDVCCRWSLIFKPALISIN